MSQKFEVRILSGKEFERVARSNHRYSNVLDEDDPSMAFADPKEGKVYIQNTHWPEVNRLLLHHELDHLVEEVGTDEDIYGVRHKKGVGHFFGQLAEHGAPLLGTVLGALGGGPLGAVAGGALGGLGGKAEHNVLKGQSAGYNLGPGAVGGGVTGAFGGFGGLNPTALGLGRAAGSGVSDVMSGRRGAFGRALTTGLGTFGAASGVQGLMGGGFHPFGSILGTNPAGQATAAQVGGGASQPASKLAGGIGKGWPGSSLTPVNSLNNPAGGGGGGGGGGWWNNIMSKFGFGQGAAGGAGGGASTAAGGGGVNWPMFGLGAGISGLGSLFAKTPKAPDFGSLPDVAALRSNLGKPISETGKLATSRLGENLSQGYQGLPPDVESGVRRQFEVERRNTASQFKLYRPGADLATDSDFRRVMQDVDARESQTLANTQLTHRQQFAENQRASIQQGLGIDSQTFEHLTNLAQLDVAQIMTQLGIDAAAAQQLKQTFGNLGGLVATRGLGLNAFPSIQIGR